MGLFKNFFHKIKVAITRTTNTSIPYVDEIKRFGNEAENDFINLLINELPDCLIKRNIIINTPEGNGEIDFLILYNDKLFAIEFKSWKGAIIEQGNDFIQKKTDIWTNEIHTKYLKSPFKQLKRAIYLLKSITSVETWIESIVYFDNTDLESISIESNNTWFKNPRDIIDFIINNCHRSKNAKAFFDSCICADHLHRHVFDKSLSCIIKRSSLCFKRDEHTIFPEEIKEITITHHITYDELYIYLIDGSCKNIKLENGSIEVDVNGSQQTYYFSKLDYVKLGRVIKKN